MGWWLLRLSANILALLRLSVNLFQLRLTKKLKINFFCFKELNNNNTTNNNNNSNNKNDFILVSMYLA